MSARGAVVGRARVVLDVDKRRYDRDMADADKRAHTTGRALKTALQAGAVGAGIALAGVGLAIRDVTKDAIDDEKALKQTEAVIRSTGGSARVTAKDIATLSRNISLQSGLQDDVVQSGANMLLTFTNVRNEVGKGNNIYDQSLLVLADMSTALGTSMPKSAIQLGKALNDPVRGITALRRVGVTFTDAQKKQIEQLDKTGNRMGAQKIILAELRKEFGGSAKAAGETFAGKMSILHQRLQGVGQELLQGLVPAVDTAVDVLGDAVGFLDEIAAAPNMRVGLEIAVEGVKDFSERIGRALGDAVGEVDWRDVGLQVGDAIGGAIEISDDALNALLRDMFDWLQAHGAEIAEFGAEMAVRMAVTLTDPAFWAEHWELLAALIAARFGGSLLRGFGGLLGRVGPFLGRGFARLGDEVGDLFMGALSRLPFSLGFLFETAVKAIRTRLHRLIDDIKGVVAITAEQIGTIPGILGRAFRFGIVASFFRLLLAALDKLMGAAQGLLEAFGRLPDKLGGDKFDAAARAVGRQRKRIQELKDELNGLKPKTVPVRVTFTASGLARGVAPNPDGRVGPWFGDGMAMATQTAFNQGLIAFPALGSSSAGGLQPYILDELAIGRSMGLTLTSGFRAGAITSTGHRSLHSTGGAIDMAGSHGEMASFARTVAGRPGIAEVIYTPVGAWYPGAGWVRPTGSVARDHFDHVHVGARGDGLIGDGRARAKKKRKPKMRPGGRDQFGRSLKPAEEKRRKALINPNLPLAIEEAIFLAEDTEGLEDDIAAWMRAERYYASGLNFARTVAERLPMRRGLREAQEKLKELRNPEAQEPEDEQGMTAAEREAEARAYVAGAVDLIRRYSSNYTPGGGGGGGTGTGVGGGGTVGGTGGAGQPAGAPRRVTVVQNFHKPPEELFPLMRSAQFVAENVMG